MRTAMFIPTLTNQGTTSSLVFDSFKAKNPQVEGFMTAQVSVQHPEDRPFPDFRLPFLSPRAA
jgi:hypothetical protein